MSDCKNSTKAPKTVIVKSLKINDSQITLAQIVTLSKNKTVPRLSGEFKPNKKYELDEYMVLCKSTSYRPSKKSKS